MTTAQLNNVTELKVAAHDDSLDDVLQLVNRLLEDAGCPTMTQRQIDIAVEELFINIAHYAYDPPQQGDVFIRIAFTVDPPTVAISLRDSGTPYDPLSHEDPDVTLPLEQRRIGGMGLLMVKTMMDNVSYRYLDGYNEITIKKVLL